MSCMPFALFFCTYSSQWNEVPRRSLLRSVIRGLTKNSLLPPALLFVKRLDTLLYSQLGVYKRHVHASESEPLN
jgi:hypothetical protein